MTTQHFLFIFLSLYTIQSYGMENNAAEIERRTLKHAENSQKRHHNAFNITALYKLLNLNKTVLLHPQEKDSLQTSLEQNIKSLRECYSGTETWSADDFDARWYAEETIQLLKK